MSWRVAVDTGGTFTDVVAVDEDSGERLVRKTPSTPDDPTEAFGQALALLPIELGDVAVALHGTTVATNAILEADYAPLGLIVTEGYRELLEVARQTVPGEFGDITWWIKPPRVVPLEHVREVGGRLDHTGAELRPLDESAVREAARELRALGLEAIAISFLHSYRSVLHEQRARELVLEEYPECFVSISSDVIREYREYERTLTTCLNSGLMPRLSSYVERLEGALDDRTRLFIMKSSGGVAGVAELIERPVGAVLSGPAAGVVGSSRAANAAGYADVLTLDMGGTSTDIALVSGGQPDILSEGRLDVYDLKAPMIDMTAVGAGGGSIAWLTGGGALRVGPKSAGSSPGPVAYGRGGTEPTLTDANLVLGRLGSTLAGGAVELDREAACAAVGEMIAAPLGLELEAAASGVLEIAAANISAGIRVVSVKRGRDPRDYALVAFGGAGPLHACLIAGELRIETVLVPPSPGASAAEGLLGADLRVDELVTDIQRDDTLDLERLGDALTEARGRALAQLEAQAFGEAESRLDSFLDLRYGGQAAELRVPLPAADGAVADSAVRDAIAAFHRTHEERYGYAYEGEEAVEIVNVGVTGTGALSSDTARAGAAASSPWSTHQVGARPVWFDGRTEETAIYERPSGEVEGSLSGPAIIEQYDSTIVIEPGWTGRQIAPGELVLERGEA